MTVVACSASAGLNPTTTTEAPPATSTTGAPTPPENRIGIEFVAGLPVEVYGPRQPGDFPVVVMLHGGGWFGGSPASMEPLASSLASEGIVVFNSTYRTSAGGYPESFDDVACDIRFALSKAGEYTTSIGPLTVVAHSAGAHIGSVVSLAGDVFGQECDVGPGVAVGRFVGLAGPYDPTLYSAVLTGYFGTRFEEDSGPWEAGSPYTYLDDNPLLEILLIHGTEDDLVPIRSSELLAEAATDAGLDVVLEELPGATHMDARNPNLVTDLIVDFVKAP
ncbi:MAG TPA: alpha/beta hydrolase [Acidimicrobiia bacterium]|nr:alpha/beta hydrolase [Acidimicrobiia bacterium]